MNSDIKTTIKYYMVNNKLICPSCKGILWSPEDPLELNIRMRELSSIITDNEFELVMEKRDEDYNITYNHYFDHSNDIIMDGGELLEEYYICGHCEERLEEITYYGIQDTIKYILNSPSCHKFKNCIGGL